LPEDFSGSSVAGVPLVGDGNPAPCINKKLHAGSLPYNSSSIFWDNVPSEMDPITLRNGSGISFMIAISFPNVRGPKTPFFTALRNSSAKSEGFPRGAVHLEEISLNATLVVLVQIADPDRSLFDCVHFRHGFRTLPLYSSRI
jgi:hypothetical protein